VYFVAQGVLTTKPNPVGQVAEKGAENLYAVDTDTSEVKFVGELCGDPTASETGHASGSVPDPQCPARGSENSQFFSETDAPLWGYGTGPTTGEPLCPGSEEPAVHYCDASSREAQTTPDGNYLVFSTYARLDEKQGLSEKEEPGKEEPTWEHVQEVEKTIGGKRVEETEKVTFPVQAVYRYSFAGGPNKEAQLTWVSHEAPGFAPALPPNCTKPDECQNAVITPLEGNKLGATAGIDDWGRAVSGCPSGLSGEEREGCPEGKYDGEYVLFTTREKLTGDDVNENHDVYLWHCSSPCPNPAREGTVGMISGGRDPEGVDLTSSGLTGSPGMSATGSDVFFTTRTQLVGQDQDELTHLYDARIDGGFPRPLAPSSCSDAGNSCQPGSQEQRELERVFGAPQPASLLFTGGGNVSTVTRLTPSVTIHAAKLKGNSVLVTFATSERGTVALAGGDFKTVRKTLAGGADQLTVALSSAGRSNKRRHAKAELEASLEVGENTATATIAVRL
jgi:hypothetical protein